MIYTCYEMIQDCRAGRPAGMAYFVSNYVPVVRKIAAHYAPADPGLIDRFMSAAVQSDLFRDAEPSPERWFLARLRQRVVGLIPQTVPEIEIDLETVAAALEPLTAVEKQAVWMETMWYSPGDAGAMLRMAHATVEKIRARASELVRGSANAWRQGILPENGLALGRAAAAASGKECLSPKAFLDVLDGRNTWGDRDGLEKHVTSCWHCVDHFCRMAEVIELLRGIRPLTEAEAEPYHRMLGAQAAKPSGWKRLFGG